MRQHFAKKRGSGNTESLDADQHEAADALERTALDSPLASLEQKELAKALREVLAELKPPPRDIVDDFYLHGLSFQEIVKKRQVPLGSVGVYLKRGLETMRRIWERHQKQL